MRIFDSFSTRKSSPVHRAVVVNEEPRIIDGSLEKVAQAISGTVVTDQNPLPLRALISNDETMVFEKARENGIAILEDGSIVTSTPCQIKLLKHYRRQLLGRNFHAKAYVVQDHVISELYEDNEDAFDKNNSEITEEEKTQASQLLDRVLMASHKRGASDIHIEIRQKKTFIKNRINSRVEMVDTISARLGEAIASVAFGVRARKDFSLEKNQQGSFSSIIDGTVLRMRINMQYVHGGADVVMRELGSHKIGSEEKIRIPSFSDLGMDREHELILNEAVQRGAGLMIFAGPTGSGKTTSIAATINIVPNHLKIYTVEDPVEKILPNASQVSITADADKQEELANELREVNKNFLRQDPDVLMVGEVRDLDAAKSLIELSITGHLALATIHTNSGLAVLTRLNDMGLSWERLATPELFSAIVYQRLVGKLCTHCRVPYQEMVESHSFFQSDNLQFAKQRITIALESIKTRFPDATIYTANTDGECKHCRNGTSGRLAAMEVIKVDRACCRIIRTGDLIQLEDHLKKQGWHSIKEHALMMVRRGLIDPFMEDSIVGPFGNNSEEECYSYEEARNRVNTGSDSFSPIELVQ